MTVAKMQTKHACCKYVHSRITVYYNCKIDIRWKRAIHSCVLCDSMAFKKLGTTCKAVHYGFCSEVSMPIPNFGIGKRKIQIRKPDVPVDIPIHPVKPKAVTQIPVTHVKPLSPTLAPGKPLHPASQVLKPTAPTQPGSPIRISVTPGKPKSQTVISVSSSKPSSPTLITVAPNKPLTPAFPLNLSVDNKTQEVRIYQQTPTKIVPNFPGRQHPGLERNIHNNFQEEREINSVYPNNVQKSIQTVSVKDYTNIPTSKTFQNVPKQSQGNTGKDYASQMALGHPKSPSKASPEYPVSSPVKQIYPNAPSVVYQVGPQSTGPVTIVKSSSPTVVTISQQKPSSPIITYSPKSPTVVPVSPTSPKSPVLLPIQALDEVDTSPPFPVDPDLDIPQKPVTVVTGKDTDSKYNVLREKDKIQDKKDQEKISQKDNHQIIVTNSLNGKENKQTVRDLPVPRTPSSVNIPRFYFPTGQPASRTAIDTVLKRVQQEFSKVEGGKVFKHHMALISKACGLPVYWKTLLFRAAGGEETKFITFQQFSTMWKGVVKENHDLPSRFVYLCQCPTGGLKQMNSTRKYLVYEDFKPLIQDIIETHPGLTFLLDAPEFHSRYVTTVISRIYFCANRSWTGKLTVQEIRKSNFLQIVDILEREEDINEITDFFSYQHFYVIYCKFWELDKDHDLFIDKADLFRHNEHALSMRVIDRIFSGAVTRGSTFEQGKMSYTEFVWFLIAEEDKKHPTSIEYWFRCMDLDGDGIISMYEMEYFYEEQMQKMEALGIEKLPFEDCLCQMLDLVSPKVKDTITLQDLKNCKMTDIFFDTFFNLDKFLDHEQRDAFANLRDPEVDGPEPSDWERYASDEYELLVAEEGANDHELEEIIYEDDFENDEDEMLERELVRVDTPKQRGTTTIINRGGKAATTDDIYDFSTNDLGY